MYEEKNTNHTKILPENGGGEMWKTVFLMFVTEGSQPPEQWKLTKNVKREIFFVSPETSSLHILRILNPKVSVTVPGRNVTQFLNYH